MSLAINQSYSGFSVVKITPLPEIAATGYELYHEFSGAKLFYVATDDDNKVFTIGFRTPSTDDTGIAHIMEHSVLCGSRKYPLREPFVELVKGSLNTFLNAMTYADKTVYPLASRNDKDFRNLMDVYLDAVFYPDIYNNPYTMLQEGWHYEIASEDAPLAYNGVVYNEMKGVYSSAEAVNENECYKALFPDSPYHFESGGFPAAIPGLTQEQFKRFHEEHYCPENSYIYLYGDMDIEDTLAYLDREYLSAFPRRGGVDFTVPLQAPFSFTKEVEAFYPVAEGEDTKNKTYLSLNIVTGDRRDLNTCAALSLLESVLLEGNAAPLKNALIKAGVGGDISGSFAQSQLQPVFTVSAGGSERELQDKFVSTIYSTLQELTVKGLDKELIEAELNSMEFRLREADFGAYPKGLIYGLSVYSTWLYGADPAETLQTDKMLDFLREKLPTRYYEELIETYLLDNAHKVLLALLPQPGLEQRRQAEEQAAMAELKKTFSGEKLKALVEECRLLHERQETPDSEEALQTIPILERGDIRRKVNPDKHRVSVDGERKILFLPRFTNKIVYLDWEFDISGIPEAELPFMYLLCDVLGRMDTDRYSYSELNTVINKYTGGFSVQAGPMVRMNNMDDFTINFSVRAKVMEDKLDYAFAIAETVGRGTDFSDLGRLREIIDELKTDWDTQFFNRGQTLAVARLTSYFSQAARVAEYDNLSYYGFLRQITANYDAALPQVAAKLQELLPKLIHGSKQLNAFCCAEELEQQVRERFAALAAKLAPSPYAGQPHAELAAQGVNEAVETPGKVQYVCAGGNFRTHGFDYTGAMPVLETILRYGYLWTKIRVQGGAYGAGAVFNRIGILLLTSYRDPKLLESLNAYRELPAYLEGFTASEREMTKYVIGTISGIDRPLTNSARLLKAVTVELTGTTYEERQKIRNEILDVSVEDIRALAGPVRAALEDNFICVIGGQEQIQKNAGLFSTVIRG